MLSISLTKQVSGMPTSKVTTLTISYIRLKTAIRFFILWQSAHPNTWLDRDLEKSVAKVKTAGHMLGLAFNQ